MARPKKCRLVDCEVSVVYFKPQGIPMRDLEEIELNLGRTWLSLHCERQH